MAWPDVGIGSTTPAVPATSRREPASSDRWFAAFNATVSVAALTLLAWLLLVRDVSGPGGADISFMPAVDAALNATAALLLSLGYVAIRLRRPDVHKYFMVSAFAASSLFLVGYVAYHYVHGDTHYDGAHRGLYLTILATHVLASMLVPPGALTAFYLAWRRRFAAHARVTRVLLPVWLYVFVTGVVVYFMLY